MVAADEAGVGLGSITAAATSEGHLRLVKWAARWPERRWAIEDCRALSRRLEGDLLKLGEQVVRVPPKMMAGVRRSARTRGKSDPIDALAVARAALRLPDHLEHSRVTLLHNTQLHQHNDPPQLGDT